MIKKFKYLLLLLIIVLFISCNNSSPINPKDYLSSDVATWEELFKAYWSGLSDNYIFWNLDDQNGEWDDIYYEYLPKFRSLGNIDYSDMKEGIFLLYDMSKILSDGHFYLEINTPSGKKSFSPSINRLLTQYNPNKTSNEINEIMYDGNYINFIDDDFSLEYAQNIIAYIFRVPIAVDVTGFESTYPDIQFYSSYSFNPKIQRRVSYNNEVLLYSTEYEYGSKVVNGEIIKVNDPYEATGPYFPLADLYWDSSNNLDTVNNYFSSWTLAIGADYYEHFIEEEHKIKKRSEFPFFSLAGITKEKSNIAENTIYFLFSDFLFAAYRDYNPKAIDAYFDYFHRLKMNDEAVGLVFDVRGNIGGYNIDRELLLGDLFSSPFQFGYQINKTGVGRHEHSLPTPLYIYPEKEYYNGEISNIINKPIVVISNTGSQSNSETLVHIVKALNGKQVGGTTLGGQGFLFASSGMPLGSNAGSFCIGSILSSVYTVSCQLLDNNYKSYEGIGLTPDIEIPFKVYDFFVSKDARLNAAFKCIKDSI